MGHTHAHPVAHFSWCTHPDACYCEVNRYAFAGIEGLIAAWIGWQISVRGGTYGGETNSLHDFSDGGFILLSAFLALLKRFHPKNAHVLDDLGMWLNNLSFIAVGTYMLYKILYVGLPPQFAGGMMFLAGLVAFAGNILQFWLLGEHLSGESDMHHASRAHVFYDILNSWAVMLGASLALVMGFEVHPLLRSVVAMLLVLITMLAAIRFGVVEYEEWDKGGRFFFWVGYVVTGAFFSFVVMGGSPQDVDAIIGFGLSGIMITGGMRNIYRRYSPGALHDQGHHHH
jgi:hypothetical protein